MCGIIGGYWPNGDVPRAALERGLAALSHRGPDGQRLWIEEDRALGFARLAIHDSTARGMQPFSAGPGGDAIVANATLHRPPPILDEAALQAAQATHGDSDCAWILPALAREGEAAFAHFDGPAAIAWQDRAGQRLVLWTDPFGQKPIFWRRVGTALVFASELGALLRAWPADDIDEDAARMLLRTGFIPGSATLARGVQRLPAGHVLRFSERALSITPGPPQSVHCEGPATPDAFGRQLGSAVGRRLRTERKVGLLLSGGLDSAAVALALKQQGAPIAGAFTMGFQEASLDEREPASLVAQHLGLPHETFVIEDDMDERLVRLVETTGEPLPDSSWLALDQLLERLGSRADVLLTGDGGDELLAGYRRHRLAYLRRRIPAFLHPLLAMGGAFLGGRRGQALRSFNQGTAQVHADMLGTMPWTDVHPHLGGPDRDPLAAVLPSPPAKASAAEHLRWAAECDLQVYLPADLCAKADRAGMRHGKELWSPFLDGAVRATAAAFAPEALLAGSMSKAPLRTWLEGQLPDAIVRGDKRGFGVPLAAWLSEGSLGRLADEVFASEADRLAPLIATAPTDLLAQVRSGWTDGAPFVHAALVLALWGRSYL